MQTVRTTIRKNRKGNVYKVVEEHYLRDDIPCGCHLCSSCSESTVPQTVPCLNVETVQPLLLPLAEKLNLPFGQLCDKNAHVVVIPDASVYLAQMDLLETRSPPFANVIVLQSELEETRRRHYRTYQRVRSLVKTTNPEEASVYVFSNLHHRLTYVNTDETSIRSRLATTFIEQQQKHKCVRMEDAPTDTDASSEDDEEEPLVTLVDFNSVMNTAEQETGESDSNSSEAQLGKKRSLDESKRASSTTARLAEAAERLVVAAARWYHRHLQKLNIQVVLLTNESGTAARAVQEGVLALSVEEYVRGMLSKYPHLEDTLAKTVAEAEARIRGDWSFEPHIDLDTAKRGLDRGVYHKGVFEVPHNYWVEGFVSVPQMGRVLIPDFRRMNRAIYGDVVVIELLPKEEWKAPSNELPSEELTLDGSKTDETIEEELNQPEEAERTIKVDDDYLPEAVVPETKDKASDAKTVPTAKVVAIWQRNTKPYCGSIEETDKKEGRVFFLPINKRIPKIQISSKQIDAIMDKRVIVAFDAWPVTSRHPLGHFVRAIGTIGDHATETEVVLMEHEVKHDPWTEAVKACLPPPDYAISEAEIAGRVDLRDVLIFSIDPPGCTDIDDALHCVPLPDGNFEVGVHIADVSHYVRPGSALDEEARQRSTSVYLVDRRIDMIPSRLSTNICSLRSGVDRLAFSCVWKMNPKAEIIDTRFFKSIIHSKAALTYADAQSRIDLPEDGSVVLDDMTLACKNMMRLALLLKQARNDQGALTLASSEVRFQLDPESGMPVDVSMYKTKQANYLVEEFMLAANVSVAKFILRAFPTFALLRRHPIPAPDMLEPLVKAAKSQGFEVDISNGRALSRSLDLIQRPGDPEFNRIVRMMTTRCLTQAVYVSAGETSPKNYFHFGLAMPTYTHFTSPIRRYADLVVHRLLATALGIEPLPNDIKDRAHMRDVVENLNYRHRMAQLASRASTEIYTLLFFKDREVEEDALVLAVKSTGVRVLVPKYGIECVVRIVPRADSPTTAAQAAKFKYDPDSLCIKCGNNPNAKVGIFDRVRVRIATKEDKMRRMWLSVELCGKTRDAIDQELGIPKSVASKDNVSSSKKGEAANAPKIPIQLTARSTQDEDSD